jgi:hypothetical protein
VIALALGAAATLFVCTSRLNFRGRRERGVDRSPVDIVILRVDDEAKPFEGGDRSTVPDGLALYKEPAPIGPSGTRMDVYARLDPRAGESFDDALARVRPWVEAHTLPPLDRWGWETVNRREEDGGVSRPVGLRTVILKGPAIVTASDVVDAFLLEHTSDGQVGVVLTLSATAAEAFRTATRDWAERRLAIVVDGRVASTRLVRREIAGGKVTITMGIGDRDTQLGHGRRFVDALQGH